MAPKLNITDREGCKIGTIEAYAGLKTRAGLVTRTTEKCMWIGGRRYVAGLTYMPGVASRYAKGAA